MSPTLTITQRWAELPGQDELPCRKEKAVWSAAAVNYVARFVKRQVGFNNAMTDWLRARQLGYVRQFQCEDSRGWHEAALDLVMWQRQLPHPQDAIAWIVGWEKLCAEAMRHLNT